MNLPDTIVYNEFTLFISQFSSVQIPTASAAHLTDLIKYFISPGNVFPQKKWDTSSSLLIYLNKDYRSLWIIIYQTWVKLFKQSPWEIYRTKEAYETYVSKMIFKCPFLSSSLFAHLSHSLINISTAKVPRKNK